MKRFSILLLATVSAFATLHTASAEVIYMGSPKSEFITARGSQSPAPDRRALNDARAQLMPAAQATHRWPGGIGSRLP